LVIMALPRRKRALSFHLPFGIPAEGFYVCPHRWVRYKGRGDKQKGLAITNLDIPDWVSSRSKDRIPKAWVGQQIVIHKPSGQELWVILRDVRDFGVVYTRVGIPDRIFCP
jgi:hypothetical protein